MFHKKKPLIFIRGLFFSGVGENRTLVQTSNQKGFYTLSFLLNFRLKARQKTATFNLALSVLERI